VAVSGAAAEAGTASPSVDGLAALGFEIFSEEPGGDGGGNIALTGLLTQLSSQLRAEKAVLKADELRPAP